METISQDKWAAHQRGQQDFKQGKPCESPFDPKTMEDAHNCYVTGWHSTACRVRLASQGVRPLGLRLA